MKSKKAKTGADSERRTCPECGAELEPDAKFCEECGTALDGKDADKGDVEESEGAEKPEEAEGENAAGEAAEPAGPEGTEDEPTTGESGDAADDGAKATKPEAPQKTKKKVPLSLTIGIAVIVALVCGFGGFFASTPINAAMHQSSATLSGDQLDNVVATYIYDGKTASVTAQDVITGTGLAANSDGSYSSPSASTIASYVQNKVLSDAADAAGITVSDDETKAYSEQALGSSDYDTIGSQYSLTGDQVKQMMAQTVKTNKLVNQVVGFDTTTPQAPTDPGKKKRSDKTEELGSYVVDLLTKAGVWDSGSNTWSATDNDYYKELGDDFDGKTASYTQAEKIYETYYSDYQTKMSTASATWQNYVSDLYSKMQLTLYGVYSS